MSIEEEMVIEQTTIKFSSELRGMKIPAGVNPPGFGAVTVEMLENIVQRIVSGVQPEKIVLFGSYAAGNPNPDSDLDILVIMETSSRPAERVLSVTRLLRPRPFPMDILVRTPQEIVDLLEAGDGFIREVMQQGKVLYEQRC
jgi:uncharacterized protein